MKNNLINVLINLIPIILMIVLIPLVPNDYGLTLIYIAIILVSLSARYQPRDLTFLVLGLLIMVAAEWFFLATGVETFNRHTLFGLMPLWLPFLWAYVFVVIKRVVKIIDPS